MDISLSQQNPQHRQIYRLQQIPSTSKPKVIQGNSITDLSSGHTRQLSMTPSDNVADIQAGRDADFSRNALRPNSETSVPLPATPGTIKLIKLRLRTSRSEQFMNSASPESSCLPLRATDHIESNFPRIHDQHVMENQAYPMASVISSSSYANLSDNILHPLTIHSSSAISSPLAEYNHVDSAQNEGLSNSWHQTSEGPKLQNILNREDLSSQSYNVNPLNFLTSDENLGPNSFPSVDASLPPVIGDQEYSNMDSNLLNEKMVSPLVESSSTCIAQQPDDLDIGFAKNEFGHTIAPDVIDGDRNSQITSSDPHEPFNFFCLESSKVTTNPNEPLPSVTTSPNSFRNKTFKYPKLNVRDALSYLEEVKSIFADNPDVYSKFFDIMKDFKRQGIETSDVISQVSNLFAGHQSLITKFNAFLPIGYQNEAEIVKDDRQRVIDKKSNTKNSEIPSNVFPVEQSFFSRVSQERIKQIHHQPDQNMKKIQQLEFPENQERRGQSEQVCKSLSNFEGKSNFVDELFDQNYATIQSNNHNVYHNGPTDFPRNVTGSGISAASLIAASQQAECSSRGPTSTPSHDLNFAMTYITKIKQHYSDSPEVYKKFLEIIKDYDNDGPQTDEVYEKLENLFQGVPGLFSELEKLMPVQTASRSAADNYSDRDIQGSIGHHPQYYGIPSTGQVGGVTKNSQPYGFTQVAQKQSQFSAAANSISSSTHHGEHFLPGKNPSQHVPPKQSAFCEGPGFYVQENFESSKYSKNADRVHNHNNAQHRTHGSSTSFSPAQKSETRRRLSLSPSPISAKRRCAESTSGDIVDPKLCSTNDSLPGIPSQDISCEYLDEINLFEALRKRINSPTIFHEFVKVLNLYSRGVISLKVMLEKTHGFLSARAPDLFKLFCDVIRNKHQHALFFRSMAPHASSQLNIKQTGSGFVSYENLFGADGKIDSPSIFGPRSTNLNQKGPSVPASEEQFTGFSKFSNAQGMETWVPVGPSYRKIKGDIRVGRCSGRNAMCELVLNDEYVSYPPTHSDANAEDQLNVHRKNVHEEQMSRVEEERYEFDVNIEAISTCIRLLEPLAQRLAGLTEDERNSFLPPPPNLYSSAPSVHQRVIKKLYGDSSAAVLDALLKSPAIAIPVVLRRLKQKDEEWRRQKREFSRIWRESDAKHYYKALDFQGSVLKANEKKFQVKSLLQEIEICYLESKEKKINKNATARHHMEFAIEDRAVIKDVLNILGVLNDPHFAALRPFLEAIFLCGAPDAEKSARAALTSVAAGGVFSQEFLPKNPPISRKKTSAQHHGEKNSSVVCFGNNNMYLILRLVQILYSRLVILKNKALELSQNPTKLPRRMNPVAFDLGLNDANSNSSATSAALLVISRQQQHVSANQSASSARYSSSSSSFGFHRPVDPISFYPTALGAIIDIIKGKIDAATFEETIRAMFGTSAYVVFYIDKTIQATMKQVKDTCLDASTGQVVHFFMGEASKPNTCMTYHQETLYRMAVEEIVAMNNTSGMDNVFRFEFHLGSQPSPLFTIQMLSPNDFLTGDEMKWNLYVENFTGTPVRGFSDLMLVDEEDPIAEVSGKQYGQNSSFLNQKKNNTSVNRSDLSESGDVDMDQPVFDNQNSSNNSNLDRTFESSDNLQRNNMESKRELNKIVDQSKNKETSPKVPYLRRNIRHLLRLQISINKAFGITPPACRQNQSESLTIQSQLEQSSEIKTDFNEDSTSLTTKSDEMSSEARETAARMELRAISPPFLANSGLQLKICVNTYRLFYLAGTEDYFARIHPKPLQRSYGENGLSKLESWLALYYYRKKIKIPGVEQNMIEDQLQKQKELSKNQQCDGEELVSMGCGPPQYNVGVIALPWKDN